MADERLLEGEAGGDRIVRTAKLKLPRSYLERAGRAESFGTSADVPASQRPFEFMLNALRLTDGIELARYGERTGLSIAAIQSRLERGERDGLLARDLARVWPTARGLDFLSDLQALFLA